MKTIEERFWVKVNKNGPSLNQELGECWIWEGARNNLGYGHMGIENATVYAHRLSYEFAFGSIPEEMDVLHKCDNPSCVRPYHLFTGTQQSNMTDKINKGRGNYASGEQCGASKLTDEQVSEIRQRETNGERQVDLAREYGINQSEISRISRLKRRNVYEKDHRS